MEEATKPDDMRGMLVAFYYWLFGNLLAIVGLVVVASSNRMQINENTKRIDRLIESRTKDRWTAADSDRWVKEFGELNPQLKLPKVRAEYREADRVK